MVESISEHLSICNDHSIGDSRTVLARAVIHRHLDATSTQAPRSFAEDTAACTATMLCNPSSAVGQYPARGSGRRRTLLAAYAGGPTVHELKPDRAFDWS